MWGPPQTFPQPTRANGVAGLALVVLMIARHLSSNHWGTLKKRFLTGPGGYRTHRGPHCEVTGRETAQIWGSAFIRVQVWGAWGVADSLSTG